MTTQQRLYVACAFVRYAIPDEYPELDHTGRRYSFLKAEPTSEDAAREMMWNMRQSAISRAWLFWYEPVDATPSEIQRYRPLDVRDYFAAIERSRNHA